MTGSNLFSISFNEAVFSKSTSLTIEDLNANDFYALVKRPIPIISNINTSTSEVITSSNITISNLSASTASISEISEYEKVIPASIIPRFDKKSFDINFTDLSP